MDPNEIKGFGRAVRLASPSRFEGEVPREAVAEPPEHRWMAWVDRASLIGHGLALLTGVALRGWIGATIGGAMADGLNGWGELFALPLALLVLFLAAYATMRLAERALRLLLDQDDPAAWPREGVDWGGQAVTLDRDGAKVETAWATRTIPFATMTELLEEDEVFIIRRERVRDIVIPKDEADEDDMRERLMRGITLARPRGVARA